LCNFSLKFNFVDLAVLDLIAGIPAKWIVLHRSKKNGCKIFSGPLRYFQTDSLYVRSQYILQ